MVRRQQSPRKASLIGVPNDCYWHILAEPGGGKRGQFVKVQPTFGRQIPQPIRTAKFERFPFDLSHDVRMGSRR